MGGDMIAFVSESTRLVTVVIIVFQVVLSGLYSREIVKTNWFEPDCGRLELVYLVPYCRLELSIEVYYW